MQSTISGNIEDNTTGNITPSDLRNDLLDLAESAVFIEDGIDTDLRYFSQDDFISEAFQGFTTAVSGAGAAVSSDTFGVNTTENVFGAYYQSTGTTTTGRAVLYTGAALTHIIFGTHELKLRVRAAVHTLSDGTDTFTVYMGWSDNISTGDVTDGAYFRYTHSVNSGKWEAVTAGGGSRTATDTGVTADTTFHIFDIRVNQAGTSVEFYIDNVLVATNTTDIPTTAEYTGIVFRIEKSAGTTARKLYEDWYDLLVTRSTAR